MSGLSRPPHRSHGATTKCAVDSMTASASGAISMSATLPTDSTNPGLSASSRRASARAGDRRRRSQAHHPVVPAVQVDDVARAGAVVEQVDVLGDEAADDAARLHGGQRAVAVVGVGAVHVRPADVVAGPVVPAERRVAGELLEVIGVRGGESGPR